MLKNYICMLISLSLVSCGGSGSGGSGGLANSAISSGLKIFVTEESHVGDFFNDPTLVGVTSIEKADDFCNKSLSKPDNATYKALLVDGINRDAVSLTDWVFEPLTDYFRVYDNVKIGTTSSASILTAFWSDMENSISDCDQVCGANGDFDVWTGIENSGDFSALNNTCDSWSASSNAYNGRFGNLSSVDGFAFSHPNGVASCAISMRIYCVEQM